MLVVCSCYQRVVGELSLRVSGIFVAGRGYPVPKASVRLFWRARFFFLDEIPQIIICKFLQIKYGVLDCVLAPSPGKAQAKPLYIY